MGEASFEQIEAAIWRKALIDAALDAVFVMDEDGLLLDMNPSAEQIFKYKKEEVIGKRMADLIIPPALRATHASGVAGLKNGKAPKILGQRLELPAVDSEGTEFPVELIVVQVPVQPRPVYVGYVRDITERKHSEAALLASARRFRALADSAPLMIWLENVDRSAGWFNKSWLSFTGRTLEEVVNRGWLEVMHPDDVAPYTEAFREAADRGESLSTEFRLLHIDGTYHWLLGNVAPTLDPDGSLNGYVGSCVDITPRRKMEMDLRLTQFTVDRAADANFLILPDGRLHYVNDQACHSLGFSKEELLSRTVADFSVEIPDGTWDLHWRKIKESNPLTFETRHRRKDGSQFPVEITVNHLQFQNQEFACAYARDISERIQAQEAVDEAMRQTQAANQAKSDFLAIVSHEMRTPLNSMLGTIELILDSPNSAAEEMLTMCRKSGLQLKELINDILDYSQIQAGKFSLQPRLMDLPKVLNRIQSIYTPRVNEKGLELRWQVAADVPPLLQGDDRRLAQVIQNLLNNAVKFTDRGYVSLKVEIESRDEELVILRFSVEDSGIGISPRQRDQIFRRFAQLDCGPTRAFGGVGLGLSICAELVELMQGTIKVESVSSGGSRFIFSSVFQQVSLGGKVTGPDDQDIPLDSKHLEGVHVLLVEDDPPSALVAKRILEMQGVVVTVATDGVEAVETFRESPEKFEAIFMDLMMPRLDGMEATKQIRRLQAVHVPIIAMTAEAILGDRERLLHQHMDGYLAKPIGRGKLRRKLIQILLEKKLRGGNPSSKAATAELATFDFNSLRQRCGDDDLLIELVALFSTTRDECMQKLEMAVASEDVEDIVNASHRLKGAVLNLCAPRAFEICRLIETDSRAGELKDAPQQLQSLRRELEDLDAAFKSEISKLQESD